MVIAGAKKRNAHQLSHLSGKNVFISLWICGDAPSYCIQRRMKSWSNIIATFLKRRRLSSWCVEGNKWSTDYFEYDTKKLLSWSLQWYLLTLHAYSFPTKKILVIFHTICFHSVLFSPTSGKLRGWQYKMNTVYPPSGVEDLLRNSFRLHHYTVSFISGGLRSSLRKHSLEFCRALLSPPSARPECQHSNSL